MKAKHQSSVAIRRRVIIKIGTVDDRQNRNAVRQGLVIPINDFPDRHIMPAFHDPQRNPLSINSRVIGTNKKQTDKKAATNRTLNEINFILAGKDTLESQASPFSQAGLTNRTSFIGRLQNRIRGVPVAKFVLSNLIRIHVDASLHPFVTKQLLRDCGFPRSIRPGHDNQDRPTFRIHRFTLESLAAETTLRIFWKCDDNAARFLRRASSPANRTTSAKPASAESSVTN